MWSGNFILAPEQEAALDATHLRRKAAEARETARLGDDIRLSRMVMEVALDLEAEAAAIEAVAVVERRDFPRLRPATGRSPSENPFGALLHMTEFDADPRQVQIINLSLGGARFRVDRPPTPGSQVILELPRHTLRLDGTILRVPGEEAAMVFSAASRANPALHRLVQQLSSPTTETSCQPAVTASAPTV